MPFAEETTFLPALYPGADAGVARFPSFRAPVSGTYTFSTCSSETNFATAILVQQIGGSYVMQQSSTCALTSCFVSGGQRYCSTNTYEYAKVQVSLTANESYIVDVKCYGSSSSCTRTPKSGTFRMLVTCPAAAGRRLTLTSPRGEGHGEGSALESVPAALLGSRRLSAASVAAWGLSDEGLRGVAAALLAASLVFGVMLLGSAALMRQSRLDASLALTTLASIGLLASFCCLASATAMRASAADANACPPRWDALGGAMVMLIGASFAAAAVVCIGFPVRRTRMASKLLHPPRLLTLQMTNNDI